MVKKHRATGACGYRADDRRERVEPG